MKDPHKHMHMQQYAITNIALINYKDEYLSQPMHQAIATCLLLSL